MNAKTISEVDIWSEVITPDKHDMSPSDANVVLRWAFNDIAKARMEQLAERNGRGELSDSEFEELEAYINVGQVIGILQAKARLSLRRISGIDAA